MSNLKDIRIEFEKCLQNMQNWNARNLFEYVHKKFSGCNKDGVCVIAKYFIISADIITSKSQSEINKKAIDSDG